MEEDNQIYKDFENKLILIITKNNFSYKTSDLKVLDGCVSFTDKFGQHVILSLDEIKFIQEQKKEKRDKW